MQHLKKGMLAALEKHLGIVTKAAKEIKIDRTSHYRWLKDDKEYEEAVLALEDAAIDFAEGKLHDLIEKGDTTATIFYLKTKGKRRGYIEKQEVDHTTKGETINIISLGKGIDPNGTPT